METDHAQMCETSYISQTIVHIRSFLSEKLSYTT